MANLPRPRLRRARDPLAAQPQPESSGPNVETIQDVRIAPFHLLAAENRVFADRSHGWHMETLSALAEQDPILQATGWRELNGESEADRESITTWWQEHTSRGGEGLVIKPATFALPEGEGKIQPAVKVRGQNYLRIIYGPDYDAPENIERLRQRGLGKKQSMALREFVLGLEGLHRFVERVPLGRVHECVLGVLALESEPVDPRL